MNPTNFTKTFLPFAQITEKKTGISALAILSQAALESGWGKSCPGNMFFGVKDSDGLNGNEQLLTTTEYSRRSDLRFPEIVSITPVIRNGQKYFKYIVKDWFRKYNTPEECFTDHANFFFRNPRYSKALEVRQNPYLFFVEISKAGYATDPNYAQLLTSIAQRIESNFSEIMMLY